MKFDHSNVERGFNMLRVFAEERGLGKPSKVLVREDDPAPWSLHGVGVQWDRDGQEPIRNAVSGNPNDIAEIKRRLEEWMNDRAT